MTVSGRWLITKLTYYWLGNALRVVCITDIPCHLNLIWKDTKPYPILKWNEIRGTWQYCGYTWPGIAIHTIEQNETGDTYLHSYDWPNWQICQQRWWTFSCWVGGLEYYRRHIFYTAHYDTYPSLPPIGLFHHVVPTRIIDGSTSYPYWQTFKISAASYPSISGIVVYIRNNNPGVKKWGLKILGSQVNLVGDMSGNCHCAGILGLDNEHRFQFTNYGLPGVEMWYTGYIDKDIYVPFLNAPIVFGAVPPLNQWVVRDLAAYIPTNAKAVVIDVFPNIAMYMANFGLRAYGSTDNRINSLGNQRNQYTAIIKVTPDRKIESYTSHYNLFGYLQGYILEGVEMYTNAKDMTPTAINAWETLPEVPIPAALQGYRDHQDTTFFMTGYAIGDEGFAFIEVNSAGAGLTGLRKLGSLSWNVTYANRHPWLLEQLFTLPP